MGNIRIQRFGLCCRSIDLQSVWYPGILNSRGMMMRVPHIAIPLLALIHLSVSTVPAEDPVEPLSLRECVAMALDSNLGLQSESLRKEIAQWAVRSERGAFEP